MNLKNKVMVWVFSLLMIGHWMEHIFQAYQVYVLHMHRQCAFGALGMIFPFLVKNESLHFVFAVLTTAGLLMLWNLFVKGRTSSYTAVWWKAATFISIWHLFEHALLFGQAAFQHNLFGAKAPTSIAQLIIPRVELHLLYNSLVTIPFIVAMVLLFRHQNDRQLAS